MRRRTLLKAGGGALPLATVASTAGRTAAQESYEPIDSVDVPGATEVVVHEDEVAYVAAGDGIVAVDVSDGADLTVLAERRGLEIDGTPLRTIWDLWAWEDRLVAAGPAQETPDSATGFVLFDIGDPAQPEQVATEATGYYIHNCFFDEGRVYLTGSGLFQAERRVPLVVYDVSDDSVQEVARWSPREYDQRWQDVPIGNRVLHDVHVENGIAYLSYWDAGTWIVDVSDPTDITVLDRFGDFEPEDLIALSRAEATNQGVVPPGNAHFTTLSDDGSLLALSKESWDIGTVTAAGGASGVELWDVSDESDVQHLTTIEPPASFQQTTQAQFTTAHNCDIAGDRLYTSWYYGGVKVHDISDPASPEELAWWRQPGTASFWAAQSVASGEYFVASSADMRMIDSGNRETRQAVYAFPDRRGEQENPPSLTGTPTPRDQTDDGSGPGFGIGAGLAALGGVGYLLGRRQTGDGEE